MAAALWPFIKFFSVLFSKTAIFGDFLGGESLSQNFKKFLTEIWPSLRLPIWNVHLNFITYLCLRLLVVTMNSSVIKALLSAALVTSVSTLASLFAVWIYTSFGSFLHAYNANVNAKNFESCTNMFYIHWSTNSEACDQNEELVKDTAFKLLKLVVTWWSVCIFQVVLFSSSPSSKVTPLPRLLQLSW